MIPKINRNDLQSLTDNQRLLRHLEYLFDALEESLSNTESIDPISAQSGSVGTPQTISSFSLGTNTNDMSNVELRSIREIVAGLSLMPVPGVPDFSNSRFAIRELLLPFTNTITVGNVTINQVSGRVIMPAAGSALVLTNNTILADSRVLLTFGGDPGTMTSIFAVTSTGSCTINMIPAVNNQVPINFLVLN